MLLRYLMRLKSNSDESKDGFLRIVRSLSASAGGSARNPKWTSYGALEIDVFVDSKPDFELLRSTLVPISQIEFVRDLNEAPRYKSKDATIAEARHLFNAERFWEAHETLEGLWRVSSGDEKLLLQGLILICAALVHLQKGEERTALDVLGRAAKQLNWSWKTYEGIDLENLRRHVEEILSAGSFQVFEI